MDKPQGCLCASCVQARRPSTPRKRAPGATFRFASLEELAQERDDRERARLASCEVENERHAVELQLPLRGLRILRYAAEHAASTLKRGADISESPDVERDAAVAEDVVGQLELVLAQLTIPGAFRDGDA